VKSLDRVRTPWAVKISTPFPKVSTAHKSNFQNHFQANSITSFSLFLDLFVGVKTFALTTLGEPAQIISPASIIDFKML
jgi:hypothetical protein